MGQNLFETSSVHRTLQNMCHKTFKYIKWKTPYHDFFKKCDQSVAAKLSRSKFKIILGCIVLGIFHKLLDQ